MKVIHHVIARKKKSIWPALEQIGEKIPFWQITKIHTTFSKGILKGKH